MGDVLVGGHAFLLESAGPVAASVLRFLRSIREEDCVSALGGELEVVARFGDKAVKLRGV